VIRSLPLHVFLLLITVPGAGLFGCGNKLPKEMLASGSTEKSSQAGEEGEVVKPPFEVKGELEGLLLVWVDKTGLHSASKRSEIAESNRQYVRVDSLQVPPEQRLDEEFVYLADLRRPQSDGSYQVRKVKRDWFESLVDRQTPEPPRPSAPQPAAAPFGSQPGAAGADVVIYGAAWCGACRSAASYLRSRNVKFAEKDIEKDRDAYAEMQRKAQAAGVRPGSLPMIDFRGHLLTGFDQQAIDRLIK